VVEVVEVVVLVRVEELEVEVDELVVEVVEVEEVVVVGSSRVDSQPAKNRAPARAAAAARAAMAVKAVFFIKLNYITIRCYILSMPELPEVETVRQDILPFVRGRTIQKLEIIDPRNIKGIKPARLKKNLAGQKIVDVERRAKYLLFKLASGNYFTVHLGMTGRLLFAPDDYVKVIFHFSGGRVLYYSDARLFGKIRYFEGYPDLKLGPEPLGHEFTPRALKEMLKGHRSAIKTLLLDQKLIAGIGNIYAIESLFRAGISPKKPANKLKDVEIRKLYHHIKQVLAEALGYRGTSDSWFLDAHGKKGGFQLRLKVYGRKGEPCFKCKTPVKRIVMGQRGTYFCPRCQK